MAATAAAPRAARTAPPPAPVRDWTADERDVFNRHVVNLRQGALSTDGIPDPDLRWAVVAGQPNGGRGLKLTRTQPASNTADTTWAGDVTLPASGGPFRLLVREFEQHTKNVTGGVTGDERIMFLETIEL